MKTQGEEPQAYENFVERTILNAGYFVTKSGELRPLKVILNGKERHELRVINGGLSCQESSR